MGAKLTTRTELTATATGDFVHVVDVSDTTDDAAGSSRKVQLANLLPASGVTAGTYTSVTVNAKGQVTAGTSPAAATGTVTSVGLTVPAGLSVTGSPVTTSGTLAIATSLSGVVKGTGSGFAAATAGTDYVTPTGSGAGLTGITGGQVSGNIAGNAAGLTATLAIASGGTGQITANAALNALLPAQASNSGKVLTTDGTSTAWGTVSSSGTGTVTSVSLTVPTGFTVTGSPLTTSGTLAIASSISGIVKCASGAFSAAVSGTDYLPTTGGTAIGTVGVVTTGTWSATVIGVTKGGTGQTSAGAAFNALCPVTTLGDLVYGSGVNASSRLAGNTTSAKQFLNQTGTGSVSAAPAWSALAASDIASGTMATARLGSGTASSSTYLRGDQTWATVSAGFTGESRSYTSDSTPSSLTLSGLGTYATILLTAAGSNWQVNLPASPSLGQVVILKRENASTNRDIYISGNGKNIDGFSARKLGAQYAYFGVMATNASSDSTGAVTKWSIIQEGSGGGGVGSIPAPVADP